MIATNENLKELLDQKYNQYNQKSFIESDPIQFPHLFSKKEDIEIAAFLSSTIAWGNRKMIINNCKKMFAIMNNSPFDFISNLDEKKLELLPKFVHRTFNNQDFHYFLKSLKNIYLHHGGLEKIFSLPYQKNFSIKDALSNFRNVFFEMPAPEKTYRHISNVDKNSACKRLNLMLMWLVRKDDVGVHFGLWKDIKSKDLLLPLDVHTSNIGRKLNLITRKQNDLKTVEEITNNLKKFEPKDPTKYDFALFGLGVNGELE